MTSHAKPTAEAELDRNMPEELLQEPKQAPHLSALFRRWLRIAGQLPVKAQRPFHANVAETATA
jgi:hypothetical protein